MLRQLQLLIDLLLSQGLPLLLALNDVGLQHRERIPQAGQSVFKPGVLALGLIDLQNQFRRERFKPSRLRQNDVAFLVQALDLLPLR